MLASPYLSVTTFTYPNASLVTQVAVPGVHDRPVPSLHDVLWPLVEYGACMCVRLCVCLFVCLFIVCICTFASYTKTWSMHVGQACYSLQNQHLVNHVHLCMCYPFLTAWMCFSIMFIVSSHKHLRVPPCTHLNEHIRHHTSTCVSPLAAHLGERNIPLERPHYQQFGWQYCLVDKPHNLGLLICKCAA